MNRHPLESYSEYLDGRSLSDAEVLALRDWIAADERHATQFVEFATLHAAVTERLRLGRLLDDLASHRSAGGITPSLVAEAIREIETNSPRVIVPLAAAAPDPDPQPWWTILAPIAAVAALLFAAVWGVWQAGEEVTLPQVAESTVVAPREPEPPKVAARLGTSFDAQWADDAVIKIGRQLVEGARLNLLSGVVKLDMVGGAAVVIEGPSEFTLTSADRLRLWAGKAAVRIGEGGQRFIVDAPSMQVIDLGTEFGVEASPDGVGQVMVFDGSVALADAAAEDAPADVDIRDASSYVNRLGAGFQVSLSGSQSLERDFLQPEVLTKPRHFLRPDEIEVRLRALGGSIADRKLAAHYERQRLEGLLAYQGFDAASGGSNFSLGIGWGLQAQGRMEFVTDSERPEGAIEVQNGPVFMGLDTSASGPFGRAGLLTDSGRIGGADNELWFTWKTRRVRAASQEIGSAGLSLMFGNQDNESEPVFVGRASGSSDAFTAQTAWGGGPPGIGSRVNAKLDFDLSAPDLQERHFDQDEHTWLARVAFRSGPDIVSVWLDVDLQTFDRHQPQSSLEVHEIEFDRIRMAVNRSDEVWRFSEFAIALEPETLYQLSEVAKFAVDK